jgi:hyperosmotically inducible protein
MHMSRTTFTSWIAAGLLAVVFATPAAARDDDSASTAKKASPASERARDKAEARTEDKRDVGDTLDDAWLVTKVKAQFWDEDALDESDINVDARDGVIILRGTVASQAGKTRAVAIARTTEGVKRVDDRLTIAVAQRDRDDDDVAESRDEAREAAKDAKRESKEAARDARDAGREAKRDTKAAARDVKEDAKEASDDAERSGRDTAGTVGETVTDGWITTKVKSSFVGEDALEDSDIDVDTNDGVVTLTGKVASQAGRARAVAIAKKIEGVKDVKDELKIQK